MIGLTLREIADATGGEVHGDEDIVVRGAASVDSRALEPDGLFVAIGGEHVDGHEFAPQAMAAGAAAVLATRPVDVPCVVVDDATLALGKIARAVLDRRADLRVIGITGSQGKTSAKDLLAQLLAAAGPTVASAGSFNNELGVPLTVLRIEPSTEFLVVEMGSRGIGHITTLCEIAPPDIAVVLNVGVAHMGEFGSADNITIAKGELVEALGDEGTAILNADDSRVATMASRTHARIITFGETGDLNLSDVTLDSNGEPHFTLTYDGQSVATSVPQIGRHHAINAAAAAAVGVAAGMNLADIGAALQEATTQSPMRMAKTVREDGVVVINDAYNANPDSMAAALRALAAVGGKGHTYAVLGEMLELGETSADAHRRIGELAADLDVFCVVTVGDGAAGIAEGAGLRAHRVADVEAAVAFLTERLRPSDVVIVKASRGGRLERVAEALLGR
ncbi:MAG: UDP-N-acetylmuramoyl-tripeptide--D-alanyl-D-alanine ligase [Actinomycetota bacterium]|nr:UDP-N-acetylmuramoyl-tripeptide--D-alanyl-D-alanine ligase [Actinomycetota bacterium]